MQLNVVEKDVAGRIQKYYKGARHLFIGCLANITEPLLGRTNCLYRNRCLEGCPFGAYFSTQSSTLPAAIKKGNLMV